jgi:predicted ATPase
VFIDAIKRRRLQIVLESHSEHLLQRLQRRMAEEVIDTEAVKLYFTAIKEGRSELTALDLDEYGNIRNWPEGFFGDTLGEAAAMMDAEMKRRMQAPQP